MSGGPPLSLISATRMRHSVLEVQVGHFVSAIFTTATLRDQVRYIMEIGALLGSWAAALADENQPAPPGSPPTRQSGFFCH